MFDNIIRSSYNMSVLLKYYIVAICKKGIIKMKDVFKIVKREKEGKTFYNVYVFGVAVRTVNPQEYSKLYYQVKGYLQNNGKVED